MSPAVGGLRTGSDSRSEINAKRVWPANALAAEQRRLLLLLDWPTLPELVQAKNAPWSIWAPEGESQCGNHLRSIW